MTETEPTEESILNQLREQDKAQFSDDKPEPKATEPEAKDEPEETAPEAKPPVEKTEPKAKAESDGSLKKEGVAEEKPKSKFEANKERQVKTWSEINAEKEALKAEKARLQAEKEAIEKERETFKKQREAGQPFRDEHGATAADYKQVAKEYRKKGEEAMADAAEKLADDLAAKEQKHRVEQTQAELRKAWQDSFSKISEKSPELKDPNSDLHKETLALLKRMPPLANHPEGLEMAVAFVENSLKGKSYEATSAELKELKSKYEALEKKLSIGSGPPTSPLSDDTPFEDLSLKEQEKRLGQLVSKADREAGLL